MGAVYDQLSITERRKIERFRHGALVVKPESAQKFRCDSPVWLQPMKRGGAETVNLGAQPASHAP